MQNWGLVLAGLFLAAGIAVAGFFASQTIVNGRVGVNVATVKGLAERIVPADQANWTVNFAVTVRSTTDPATAALYARADTKQSAITEVLEKAGFLTDSYAVTPLRYSEFDNRDYEGNFIDKSYTVFGQVTLTTDDLDRTERAYFAMAELPRRGITLSLDAPHYLFTDLNAIKPDMLREATANARIAAEEFADKAGVRVGGIQSATQGGFSVQDSGVGGGGDTGSREKLVRVVTTITFYLEN